MYRSKFSLIIICLFFMASSKSKSEDDVRTTCTNTDKKRMLVKKGVMTRDLCLSTIGDKLKVNIVGETFRLGSEKYTRARFTEEGGICGTIAKPDEDDKKELAIKPVDLRLKMSKFRDFLIKLRADINTRRRIKDPQAEDLKFLLNATGYADGVRNRLGIFDKYILRDLELVKGSETPLRPDQYNAITQYVTKAHVEEYNTLETKRKHQINYPLGPDDYKKLACHPDRLLEIYSGKMRLVNKNFLTPLRNHKLARARAYTLTNSILTKDERITNTKNSEGTESLNPDIKIAQDPEFNTGKKMCYGYCEGHRGAKIDLTIPTLKEVAVLEKEEFLQFPIAFNTPGSGEQRNMNHAAVRDYFNDVSEYILKNGDYGTGFKSFLKDLANSHPKIKITPPSKAENKVGHFEMSFPIKDHKGVETVFSPYLGAVVGNPFTIDSPEKPTQPKLNEILFTYLDKNVKNTGGIDYRDQDRKFLIKYFSARLGLTEEKVKENKDLINWAIILFWSRYGNSEVSSSGKLTKINQTESINYIDSLYTANLSSPSDQRLAVLYKEVIKDQSTSFKDFEDGSNRFVRAHVKLERLLGAIKRDDLPNEYNTVKALRTLLKPKDQKNNESVDELITYGLKIYSLSNVYIYKFIDSSKGDKPIKIDKKNAPLSVRGLIQMFRNSTAYMNPKKVVLEPNQFFNNTNGHSKIVKNIFGTRTFQARMLKSSKGLHTGIYVASMLRSLAYIPKALRIQLLSNKENHSCYKGVYGKNGAYTVSTSGTEECNYVKILAEAKTQKQINQVILDVFKKPSKTFFISGKMNELYTKLFKYSIDPPDEEQGKAFEEIIESFSNYFFNLRTKIEKDNKYGKIVYTTGDKFAEALRFADITNDTKLDPIKTTLSSVGGGNDSTIFSYLDYNKAYSGLYKKEGIESMKTRFSLFPLKSPIDVNAIFYSPDTIETATDEESKNYKGFFHTACKTGVFFDMDPVNKKTKFEYQARLNVRKKYKDPTCTSCKNANQKKIAKQFDDTYKLGFENHLNKNDFFNIIKLKHPTAYLLNCENCNCFNNLSDTITMKDIITKNLVKHDSIEGKTAIMRFSSEFEWETVQKDKTIPLKKYMLKDLIGHDITAEESRKYCVVAPLVPQTHYVGKGSAESSNPPKDPSKNDNIIPEPCPIINVLSKMNGTAVSSVAEQDEIIKFCENISNNYPFENERECLGEKNNTFCSFVDKKSFPECSNNKYGAAAWKSFSTDFCNAL